MGVLAWTTIRASWKLRCSVKHNPDARHTFFLFLKQSLSVLKTLAQANCYVFISIDQVHIFISAIESLVPSLSITPPPPLEAVGPGGYQGRPQAAAQKERDAELEELPPWLIERCCCLIFRNGSS